MPRPPRDRREGQAFDIEAPRRDAAAMGHDRGPLGSGFHTLPERQPHRVLTASAEQGAAIAVVRDLLRHPDVRHDREPEPHEVAWCMCERAESGVAGCRRLRGQVRDQASADFLAAERLVDDQRTDFGHGRAQPRQFGAADHQTLPLRDEESRDVISDVFNRPWQQVTRFEVRQHE
jgi:hypothetical protein